MSNTTRMGRPPIPVFLTGDMKNQLQEICDNAETSRVLRRRCRAILLAADGKSTTEIAREIGTSSSQVSVWRRRFANHGYEGLVDLRSSRIADGPVHTHAALLNGPKGLPNLRYRQRGAVAEIKLTPEQRAELLAWAKAPLIENRLAQRARAVLQADDGYPAPVISDRIGMSSVQVLHWCRRFLEEGQEGLRDRPRSGRPANPVGIEVEALRAKLQEEPPSGRSRWTGASLARALDIPDYQVRKLLREARINLRTYRG